MEELVQRYPDIRISWRAFELRPEPVPLLDPDGDYLTSAWDNHVYPLAKAMKMVMKMPPIQTRSRMAHEAAKWAASHDRFAEYNLSLFKAFFQSGIDIGKVEILAQLAEELKLDSQELTAALKARSFSKEVDKDQEEARHVGVRAVPAFAMNGRVLAAGVQTADRLQSLICK